MAQLRRMLGVLKDGPDAGRSPQPTLAGLGALVDEVRRQPGCRRRTPLPRRSGWVARTAGGWARRGRRVITPAGLKDTYSGGNDPRIQGRHTRGYQAVKAKDGSSRFVDVTEWNQSITWASGDLITTTADLERFSSALFRGRVVPEPELRLMFTVPDVPAYSPGGDPAKDRKATYTSGLTRVEVGKTVVYGKTGGRYGYLNGFGATPDRSRTVVYSVNSTDAKSETPSPVVGRIIEAGFGR
ncbi:serine hydrolase [Streptomyces syringium]|uniref:serine hydrolase n=1 Tax=Streptomyces syringium TaxID=76729 RepID=UPI0034319BA9